jgi:hypothetical protein
MSPANLSETSLPICPYSGEDIRNEDDWPILEIILKPVKMFLFRMEQQK